MSSTWWALLLSCEVKPFGNSQVVQLIKYDWNTILSITYLNFHKKRKLMIWFGWFGWFYFQLKKCFPLKLAKQELTKLFLTIRSMIALKICYHCVLSMLIPSKSEQFVMSADISFPSNNPNAPHPLIKIYLLSMLTFPNKKCVLPDL